MNIIRIIYLTALFGYWAIPFLYNEIIPIDTSLKALLTPLNVFPFFALVLIIVCIEFSHAGRKEHSRKTATDSNANDCLPVVTAMAVGLLSETGNSDDADFST